MDEGAKKGAEQPDGQARAGRPPLPGIALRPILALEHAQDVITATVGLVLVILAAILLISGVASFIHELSVTRILTDASILVAATKLFDEVLLVLILIEIVHTVVLSLLTHALVARPFIIVGLVAVIRKILFVLSGERVVSTSVIALLLAMVEVFVLSLAVVSRFERNPERELTSFSRAAARQLQRRRQDRARQR
jgi:uncharacterized membrane protein (DUF373 family)